MILCHWLRLISAVDSLGWCIRGPQLMGFLIFNNIRIHICFGFGFSFPQLQIQPFTLLLGLGPFMLFYDNVLFWWVLVFLSEFFMIMFALIYSLLVQLRIEIEGLREERKRQEKTNISCSVAHRNREEKLKSGWVYVFFDLSCNGKK